jgi:mRNA interferase MazF
MALLPNAGDVAWAELDPVLGSEQAGRRPALVLTTREYHQRSRRALIAPIMRNPKEWTFHVPIPGGLKVEGMVMVDQVRMVDRASRLFDVIDSVPDETLAVVRGRLAALIGFDPPAAPNSEVP